MNTVNAKSTFATAASKGIETKQTKLDKAFTGIKQMVDVNLDIAKGTIEKHLADGLPVAATIDMKSDEACQFTQDGVFYLSFALAAQSAGWDQLKFVRDSCQKGDAPALEGMDVLSRHVANFLGLDTDDAKSLSVVIGSRLQSLDSPASITLHIKGVDSALASVFKKTADDFEGTESNGDFMRQCYLYGGR